MTDEQTIKRLLDADERGVKRTYSVMLTARELDYLLRLVAVESALDEESQHLPEEAERCGSAEDALRAATSPHKGRL